MLFTPIPTHSELFGNDLPTRQKELKEKADLAESLGKPTEKHPSYKFKRQNQQNTPYTRPPTSTQSTSKPTWLQRRQQQDTRAPMRG